jgi:lysophospholipase L1-like esterase
MLLAPIALVQGVMLRRSLPRLPEAGGERAGITGPGEKPLRLVAVGESPLAGVGLADQGETLTARLAELLTIKLNRPVQWQTAARGGVTARQTCQHLVELLEPKPASLILVGLGVNDSLKQQGIERWQQDLIALIEALRARVGPAPVILTGVPDMGRFPALPAPLSILLGSRARLLDAASAELAARLERVQHVGMSLDARIEKLFCHDGFHPSAEGHQRWAEHLLRAALAQVDF